MIDPYQTLGVSKSASQEEIKKAYRTIVKKCHPDLNPGKKDLEAKFKKVSSAYKLIGSPEARAKFDRGETAEQQQHAQQEQAKSYYQTQQEGGRYSQSFGQDMGEDFFENLFRAGAGGARQGSRGRRDFPGEDHVYKMDVEFRDAALGAEKEITLPSGKKLLVKIPAGISSGSKLRFRGQGGPGIGNGPAGDAYVEITTKPLSGFTRVDKNIETELPISFQEGLLGAEVKVPTLEGSVMMKIQPGVSTGSRLRIKGKGAGPEGARGDQIVVLKVVLPSTVDPKLQETLKEWAGKYDYNPRGEL